MTRVVPTRPELAAPGTAGAPYEPVLAIADLPEGGLVRVTRGDLDILLAHLPGGIVATDDRCPHMAAPLSIGRLDGCVVDCPLHTAGSTWPRARRSRCRQPVASTLTGAFIRPGRRRAWSRSRSRRAARPTRAA
jgi:hypothetical protein